MSARLSVGVAGLVLALLAGLAGAATLAQEPSPTPTAEPIPTQPPLPEPLSAGCAPGASLSPSAPNAPSGLWLEEDANPNLPDLPPTVVVLRWADNSSDELCFAVERRVGDGPWEWLSAVPANVRGTYGDGLPSGDQCYRVSAGNDAGRSEYSNEVCMGAPGQAIATPPWIPTGCSFPPSTATAAPAAPSDLRAELVPDPELASGFVVQLTWQDNSTNETCYELIVRLDGELVYGGGGMPSATSSTGPQTMTNIPNRTGLLCYQVYYGNIAGGAYSNEACVDVEVLPVWRTATPTYPLVTATPPSVAPTPPAASPAATANPDSAALVAPRALPSTGAGHEGIALAWWWALAACGAVLLGITAVSLVVAARRRP